MNDDIKTSVTFPNGEIVDFGDGKLADALAQMLLKGMSRNQALVEIFRSAVIAVKQSHELTIVAYQDMVGKWEGETPAPLKSAEQFIEFGKHVGKIQAGLEGLEALLEDTMQLRLF